LINTPIATTTVFPVGLLPETGARELQHEAWAFSGGFLLLVLVSSLAVIYFWGKDNT